MKKIIKQWKQKIQTLNMTVSEKDEVKNAILSFMDANPVRNAKPMRHIQYWGENFSRVLFLKRKYMFATLAVILALALGGGTSFAAEQAVPGDALYQIKVHVNEPVREILSITPETKAEWQGKKIERRLEEASQLASKGTLDATTTAELAKSVSEQVAEFKKSIDDVKRKKGEGAALEIEADVEANVHAQEILLGNTKRSIRIPVIISLPAVGLDNSTSTATTTSLIQTEFMKKAAQNKRENAQNKINEAEKITGESKTTSTIQGSLSALLLAKETINNADILFANGNFSEAFFMYQRAHELAQTAKLLAKSNKHEEKPQIKFELFTPTSTIPSTSTIQIPVEIKIKLDDDKNLIKIELENNDHSKKESAEREKKENQGQNGKNDDDSQRDDGNKSGKQ